MTALAEALLAAQRQASGALTKAYSAGLLQRDVWESDRDDAEREAMMDAFMADCRRYEQTGA